MNKQLGLLTKKQMQIFLFIKEFAEKYENFPPDRVIAAKFHMLQTAARDYRERLERKGYIEKQLINYNYRENIKVWQGYKVTNIAKNVIFEEAD